MDGIDESHVGVLSFLLSQVGCFLELWRGAVDAESFGGSER